MANAASFNWQAANLYGSDNTTTWSGSVELYAIISGTDTLVHTATATSGAVKKTDTEFSNAIFEVGNAYDFYFVINDGDKSFTSGKVTASAQATSTITVNFGNMKEATQNPANWSGSAVPEPTSGLLMFLGMAGLALRRRRA